MATDDNNKSGDIEKQLLDSPHDQSSPSPPPLPPPTTTTTTIVSMDVENVNDKPDVKVEESSPNPTTTSCPSKMEDAIISLILYTLLFFFILLMFPLFMVYVLGSICFTGKVIWPDECCSSSEDNVSRVLSNSESRPKGIYKKMQDFESTKEKLHHLNLLTTTRVGCIALLWLVLNICVPSLTHVAIFGYPLCKWSFLVVIILLGYPLTVICTMVLSFIITENHSVKRHNLEYFIKGLERSIASLIHFTLLLLLWLFYFRTDHGLHPSEKVDKFGTWTFVSIVVGAILWVTKSATLLEWKANAVYKRFKGRILTAGFQIYFLSIIINALTFESLLPWRDNNELIQDQTTTKMKSDEKTTEEIIDNNCKSSTTKDRKNLSIQDYMLSKVVPIHQIENVARFVTDLAEVTLRENDGIPEIVAKCQEKIPTSDESTIQYITKETLEEIFGLSKEDAQLLLQELRGEQLSDEITYDAFQKWIVDAHKNCLSVGYTLIDAFAVVSVLNRVIIGFIVVMVILVWLLITKLATTKVLVLIASPFLTFSFVFGDTCKTFFQGIIFSFVTHPYDVGDRCIIDGIELEVKRIAILTTTFVRIGTKERVIYPNASLVTKVITNLEGEPDPSDMIDLVLDSSTTKLKILSLREDLESFFKNNDQHGYERKIHVAVKDIGSTIKVSVCFTHVMNVQDVSHSQCLQKKNKQRSELLIDIKQFLEDREIKLATS